MPCTARMFAIAHHGKSGCYGLVRTGELMTAWTLTGWLPMFRACFIAGPAKPAIPPDGGKSPPWRANWKRTALRATMLVASRHRVVVHHSDLDKGHFLLNCRNGTIDLTTGQLRAHDRADLLTHDTEILYDRDATAPDLDCGFFTKCSRATPT